MMFKRILFIGLFLLSSAAFAEELQNIDVELGKSKMLPISGITRVVVINENIASVSVRANALEISGSRMGSTLIHVWSGETRKSYQITIAAPVVERAANSNPASDPGYKVGVSAGRIGGTATSPHYKNRYGYSTDYAVLDSYGNTPVGFVNSHISYKIRTEKEGTVKDFDNVRLSVEKDNSKIEFGDQQIRYSDYVLPDQDIQGLSYTTKFGVSQLNVVYGVNKNGWWGSDIFRELRVIQKFTGFRLVHPFSRDLELGINAIVKQENDQDDCSVLGAFGRYTVMPHLQSFAEVGLNSDKKAGKIGLAYTGSGLGLEGTYRTSSSGYETARGHYFNGGEMGIYLKTYVNVNKNINFNANYNNYETTAISDHANSELNANTNIEYGSVRVSHVLWQKDIGAYNGSGIGQGQNLGVSYIIEPVKTSIYYRFSPSTYKEDRSIATQNTSYDLTTNLFGARSTILPNTSLTCEYQKDDKDGNLTGHSTPSYLRSYIAIDRLKVYGSSLYAGIYGRLQANYDSSTVLEQISKYISLRFDWMVADDQKAYLTGAITDIQAKSSLEADMVLREFKVGMTWFWDTGLKYSSRHNRIKGFIFLDGNSNGILDADEEGMSGVKVKLSNGKEAVSDKGGMYEFKDVTDESVSAEIAEMPKGYLLTTPGKQTMQMGYGKTITVDFGISGKAVVMGLVFLDSNANGEYDPGELLIQNVKVSVKGFATDTSDANGFFKMADIPAGRQTFSLELHTITMDYMPVGAVTREISVEPGKKMTVLVPLKLAR